MISIAENRDCMEAMAEFPDKFFDLAIVDPPYGIGDFRGGASSRRRHKKIEWNSQIPSHEYFNELYRVSKNRIIFGCNYYGKYITDTGRIVHDKTGGGRVMGTMEMSNCDIASHSFGVNMKIFHYTSIGNIIGNSVDFKNELRWHPCQKPIALYKWIMQNYGTAGDKILDTHLGSGTSRIAAHDMGFDFWGYEIDKDYFQDQEKRFKQHTSQLTLL